MHYKNKLEYQCSMRVTIFVTSFTWSKMQQVFRIDKNLALNFFKPLKRFNDILKDRRNSW